MIMIAVSYTPNIHNILQISQPSKPIQYTNISLHLVLLNVSSSPVPQWSLLDAPQTAHVHAGARLCFRTGCSAGTNAVSLAPLLLLVATCVSCKKRLLVRTINNGLVESQNEKMYIRIISIIYTHMYIYICAGVTSLIDGCLMTASV